MKNLFHLLQVLIAFFALCILSGCTGYSVTGGPGKTVRSPLESVMLDLDALRSVSSLYIAPMIIESDAAKGVHGIEDSMYAQFIEMAKKELGIDILSVNGEEKKIIASGGVHPHFQWLLKARERGADGMLVIHLFNYVKRNGSAVGSEAPASVGMSLSVYRASDDREAWRASYFYQDQALSENLFRFGSSDSHGWVSAEKLFEKGVATVIADLASKRMSIFSGSSNN